MDPEILKAIAALKVKPKKLPWWKKRRLMNLIWKWLESQIIKAAWSWPTTVYGIILGMSLILPELAKLLDGDVKTVPSESQIAAGLAAMGFGLVSKSNSNTGLAPTPTLTAAQVTVADTKATVVQAKIDTAEMVAEAKSASKDNSKSTK